MDELQKLIESAKAEFAAASQPAALEDAKARYVGKSGAVTQLMKGLRELPPEERRARGQAINAVKQAIEEALNERREAIANEAMEKKLAAESIDVTLPGRSTHVGGIHPVIRTWMRVEEIFRSIGFDVADGPEIESDWYSFTALNNPPNPPAPGRTYRVDSDATHSPMFHQVEGLWIGDNVSFTDLKAVYTNFLRCFFETEDLIVRFRPSYFPFTEPSVEVDMAFTTGPRKGKWLEISGAGEVHPNVVRNYGLDPEKYIGFAFGSGLERLTMLRYGISDLRLFFEGDLRFLQQFNN